MTNQALNTTEPTESIDTTSATINTTDGPKTIIIVNPVELSMAKTFWKAQVRLGAPNRQKWALLGKVCSDYQAAYLSQVGKRCPNQEFGSWRSEQFPGIRADQASYAIALWEEFEAIEAWAKQACPDLATPKALVQKYRAFIKGKGKLTTVPRTPNGPTDDTTDGDTDGDTEVTDTDGDTDTDATDGDTEVTDDDTDELNFQELDTINKEVVGKLVKRLDKETSDLYDLLKGKGKPFLTPYDRALLKNRFQALLALLS
jgi:hypothetical protein